MKKIKTLTSKFGTKMVIAIDQRGFSVFTAEEYEQGNGYRVAEFEGIEEIKEAISQAKNF